MKELDGDEVPKIFSKIIILISDTCKAAPPMGNPIPSDCILFYHDITPVRSFR